MNHFGECYTLTSAFLFAFVYFNKKILNRHLAAELKSDILNRKKLSSNDKDQKKVLLTSLIRLFKGFFIYLCEKRNQMFGFLIRIFWCG